MRKMLVRASRRSIARQDRTARRISALPWWQRRKPRRRGFAIYSFTARLAGANLNWLVNDKGIAPHIPVIDKSKREDGTFSRKDFTFDKDRNVYICPANKILTTTGKLVNDGETLLYRTKVRDCRGCLLKARCCPKTSVRKIPRSIYEESRDIARGAGQDRGVQAIKPRQETCRDAVCAFEAYPAARAAAIARTLRCPVRVHLGRDCLEPPQACQADRPATANRPFVRCVSIASVSKVGRSRPHHPAGDNGSL